jgi:hypothetical protein
MTRRLARTSTFLLFVSLAALVAAGCGHAGASGTLAESASRSPGSAVADPRTPGRTPSQNPTGTLPTSLPQLNSIPCQAFLIVTSAAAESSKHLDDPRAVANLYRRAASRIRAIAAQAPGTAEALSLPSTTSPSNWSAWPSNWPPTPPGRRTPSASPTL